MRKIMNDFTLDTSSGDLKIVNGDFVLSDCTFQHQRLLILASKGDIKLRPLVGVDGFMYLHDHKKTFSRDVRVEFIKDGMQVNACYDFNGKLIYDANY